MSHGRERWGLRKPGSPGVAHEAAGGTGAAHEAAALSSHLLLPSWRAGPASPGLWLFQDKLEIQAFL